MNNFKMLKSCENEIEMVEKIFHIIYRLDLYNIDESVSKILILKYLKEETADF